ncbi:metalloregulator ArsR/SmtB family transcription factor [Actinokineospora sp. NPDC004072]
MDLVAGAIADPVRRDILEMLRDGPLPAGAIAARFAISRPAVSRHLRVLRESGLVRDAAVGRRRVYALDPAPLADLAAWIARFGAAPAWQRRLDALATEVHRARRDRRACPSVPEESTA